MFHIKSLKSLLPNQPHNPQHGQEGKSGYKVQTILFDDSVGSSNRISEERQMWRIEGKHSESDS